MEARLTGGSTPPTAPATPHATARKNANARKNAAARETANTRQCANARTNADGGPGQHRPRPPYPARAPPGAPDRRGVRYFFAPARSSNIADRNSLDQASSSRPTSGLPPIRPVDGLGTSSWLVAAFTWLRG
ncbi:hypothetical protein SAMN05216371_3445 [Streptomyces sp. TLI_053]|nr:hypothetical protein SAMN05216371_3445 [Streptomyces sp. TLI_053]